MGDLKFDQQNKGPETSTNQEGHNFAAEKYPAGNGFVYELYFTTEAEAEEKRFEPNRYPGILVKERRSNLRRDQNAFDRTFAPMSCLYCMPSN